MVRWLKYIVIGIYPLFVILVLLAIITFDPGSVISGLVNREVLSSVKLSIICAVTATALAVIFGTPLAYYLARRDFYGKSILETLIDLPISVPPLVCGVGLLLLFGHNGWIGKSLAAAGIHIVFTLKGAIIAQFFVAAPLYIQVMRTTFRTIDSRYETVAKTLGSGSLGSFLKITVPLSREGIINGTTMAFARCMGEFGATLMLASAITYKTETLPLCVFMNMSGGNISMAIAAASILILVSLIIIIIMRISVKMIRK